MELLQKLEILADAAKYDASCASSGTTRRNSLSGGLGSTEGSGICHAYAPDGRCISLLKVLLTNACVFDCAYCINRASSNTPRARFTVEEVVQLTLGFYRRNVIEGLFLSSGIIRSPDYTMEQVVRVARSLREEHGFRGYIHLKTIPDADPGLLAEAGRHADRLSINLELPTAAGLESLAPEKSHRRIRHAMAGLRQQIEGAEAARKEARRARPDRFAPAGQSTQMIVGADGADDGAILGTATDLYASYRMRRVYYSAYSPIPEASRLLPPSPPPLVREHRLYQADWLLRFYGFSREEVMAGGQGGMLDLELDPKTAWALQSRASFPVDVNRAPREALLRVPGLGAKTVDRLLAARRHATLRVADLARLRVSLPRVLPFVVLTDHVPRGLEAEGLRRRLLPATAFAALAKPRQMALF
ncbi:putative DNA modification/repair radical SAM protein [Falsiroseomonas selenitidurans]|uniref:DNA modification/repair radical SAM protein n=1 Tax=Falsiroseomonas selenitidurans TaxID=2716335 RepID=A0ABX1E5A8_9PROT|nr:putative DNA modification/repair radical SAM protein [Falsiroseomonas selenitidurans]NKC32356.1 putative DNA modification/repair radical SAM protein [Falsiroseomonas selenitidurans]